MATRRETKTMTEIETLPRSNLAPPLSEDHADFLHSHAVRMMSVEVTRMCIWVKTTTTTDATKTTTKTKSADRVMSSV